MTLGDSVIRPLLNSDIRAAWDDLEAVNDDRPRLPRSPANYPQAFLFLGDVTIEKIGNVARRTVLPYTIMYLGKNPARAENLSVQEKKAELVESLLARIAPDAVPPARSRYHGYDREITSIRFTEDDDFFPVSEDLFYVTIDFTVYYPTKP